MKGYQEPAPKRNKNISGSKGLAMNSTTQLNIQQWFRQQVQKTPDAIALLGMEQGKMNCPLNSAGLDHLQISYKELDDLSDLLANHLQKRGVRPDSIVGIFLDRSVLMIIGILAIQKAGGAYLPIDPEYPQKRIRYMLLDSGSELILSTKHLVGVLSKNLHSPEESNNPPTPHLNPIQKEVGLFKNLDIFRMIHKGGDIKFQTCQPLYSTPINPFGSFQRESHQLCYIIYTSGTTGRPKGVGIEHSNVIGLMEGVKSLFHFNNSDIWTMFHSYCFDFSVWEMYGALLFGGKLIIIPKEITKDPGKFLMVMKRHRVTVLNQTPFSFYNLAAKEINQKENHLQLRYVIFGGEALNPGKLKLWRTKYPKTKLINMFGITETTVHVTYKEITDLDIKDNRSNIGKPIPSLYTLMMDKKGLAVPEGDAGELLVGGLGVARGYINRPELTACKFLIQKSSPLNSSIYKSGDLVRLIKFSDGEMEYFGRIDHQVQVRGFRVELGEIENQILQYENIKDSVILAKEDESSGTYLCAYLVPDPHRPVSVSELRKYLTKHLPHYMIPSHFITIDKIPLNSNGKLDRKKLESIRLKTTDHYTAPRNRLEEKMVKIWSDILDMDLDSIGIDSNFFESGGHSLNAVTLAAKTHKILKIKFTLQDIYELQTIREMAREIKNKKNLNSLSHFIEASEKRDYYPLPAQHQKLYKDEFKQKNLRFNTLATYVVEGTFNIDQYEEALFKLIQRHEVFRTYFTELNGEVIQRIKNIEEVDKIRLEIVPSKEKEIEGQIKNFKKPFDLSQAPLLRTRILRIDKEINILILDIHHIITDAISIDVMLKDIAYFYENRPLKPLSLQFKDFSVWYRSPLAEKIILEQEMYWRNKMKYFKCSALPQDYSNDLKEKECRVEILNFQSDIYKEIERFCNQFKVTRFTFFMAVFFIILAKEISEKDITIGIRASSRPGYELRHALGCFLNKLLLRSQLDWEDSFLQHLQKTNETIIEAMDNALIPYEPLEIKIREENNISIKRLFSIKINYLPPAENEIGLFSPPLKITPYNIKKISSNYNIALTISEFKDSIELNMVYNGALYSEKRIKNMMRGIDKIIANALQDVNFSLKHAAHATYSRSA